MKDFPVEYDLQHHDVLYFCHIPKTAGMTFRTILEDQFPCDEICPATLKSQINEISAEALNHYRLFRGHLISVDLPQIVPNKRVINVTVLREPVARIISHYDYICRTPGDPHHVEVKNMTLEDFSQKMTVARVGKNIQAYHVAKAIKFDIESLPAQDVLQLAKESIDKFAFAGILEQFQDSLFLLSYILGWKPIVNSRKENAAASKYYDRIPASTIDIIRENTQLDQELYQHAKATFESRFERMQHDLLKKYAPALLETPGNPLRHLTPELTLNLLEKHHEARYSALQIPTSTSVQYDFCQPLRGRGWQRRECPTHGVAYRWTGPEITSSLELPIAPSPEDLIIEFRTILTLVTAPDILDSLTLAVNDKPIDLQILHSDPNSKIYQGVIPTAALNADEVFTHFVFTVNRVVSFKTINPVSPDSRLIGVAINGLQVYPASLQSEKSILRGLFDDHRWYDTANFVQKQLKADDRVMAPLAFKLRLSAPVIEPGEVFSHRPPAWIILNKGSMDKMSSMLLKLISKGFAPVFANEVFVVFCQHQDVKKISYLSSHVRSLYIDRLKVYIKSYLNQRVKPIHASFRRNQSRLQSAKKK